MGPIEVAIIIGMLLLNSLFAAYELALASASLGRLRLLADQKKLGAAAALAMKNRMEASLAVVQIGITLAGAIAAATGGSGAEETIAPRFEQALGLSSGLAEVLAIAIVVLPLSAITIIFGELVPKSLAIRNSEWFCLKLSPFMRAFALIVYPAVVAFERSTKMLVKAFERNMPSEVSPGYEMGLAELRAQAHALRAGRVIGMDQERIIMGASALDKTRVVDILVPPQDVVMLHADAPLTDHLIVVHLEGYTRFPVSETPGDVQGIIGYVNLKELMFLAKTYPDAPSLHRAAAHRRNAASPRGAQTQACRNDRPLHASLGCNRRTPPDECGLRRLPP